MQNKDLKSITIRRLIPGDTLLARDLFQNYLYDEELGRPVVLSDEYINKLLSNESLYIFVAINEDSVVGGLTAYEMEMYKRETKEVFFYEIEVDEQFRQQGIATKLVEELKNHSKERGASVIFVGTEPDNTAAKKLYKKTSGNNEEGYVGFTYNL